MAGSSFSVNTLSVAEVNRVLQLIQKQLATATGGTDTAPGAAGLGRAISIQANGSLGGINPRPGSTGAAGSTGAQGPPGPAGPIGLTGPAGVDGSDANIGSVVVARTPQSEVVLLSDGDVVTDSDGYAILANVWEFSVVCTSDGEIVVS